MRPVLKPALRRVWRDDRTLQLGVDPRRAVVLTDLDPAATRLLDLLDGTRDEPGLAVAAALAGVESGACDRLLALLGSAAALDDAGADNAALAGLTVAERERLAPDLASLSLLRPAPGAALAALARRRRAAVVVHGAGRVGAPLAALLAAAGVGRVSVVDDAPTRHADAAPAGLQPDDHGAPRETATRAALRRTAPFARSEPPGPRDPCDLAVLAPVGPLDPSLVAGLVSRGTPHLLAGVRETTAIIGPLVLPGRSACLRCTDLVRADRDPAWPRIAAQLARPPHGRTEPEDVVLAAAASALAAGQALAHLDAAPGEPPVPVVGGTLELALPEWRLRRRSWPAHPGCGCCAEA